MRHWLSKAGLAGAALLGLWTAPARADFLELADGNIVEVDLVAMIQKPNPRGGKPIDYYDCKDEKGETRQFRASEVVNAWKTKSSWRQREENEKWYEKEGPKAPKTWLGQMDMGKQCRKKGLEVEAILHFREAYALRQEVPLAKDESKELRLRRLAEWLEKECGMFDEAINEYEKVYAEIKDRHKTAAERLKLANWCVQHDLEKQAEEQFKAAIAEAPTDRIVKVEYEKFRRSQIVPLHQEMYRALKPNFDGAMKILKAKQKPDGSFGSDASEARVQAWRGMTAISAEALMCDWDLKYFVDPDACAKAPKELTKALDFLLTGNKSEDRKFMGKDLWGPTFSLNFLLRCLTRPYLQDRKYEICERINKEIALLKGLQLSDGGWYYYDFQPISGSFVTAGILANLIVAKNYGFDVEQPMLDRARELLTKCNFGKGTYTYSADGGREGGKNTSFSPVGASARSPLCEWALMSAGAGNQDSLVKAITHFYLYQPILGKLRGSDRTHIGKARTAPYYYMYGHMWTARALKQMPRGIYNGAAQQMRVFVVTCQEPDGSFKDWTGTKDYQVYATALGVMTMFQLMTNENDPAFLTPGQIKDITARLDVRAPKPGGTPVASPNDDKKPVTPVTLKDDKTPADKKAETPGEKKPETPAETKPEKPKAEEGANDFDDLNRDEKKPVGNAADKKPEEKKTDAKKPEEKKPDEKAPATPEKAPETKTEAKADEKKPAEKPADKTDKPAEKAAEKPETKAEKAPEKPADKPAEKKKSINEE